MYKNVRSRFRLVQGSACESFAPEVRNQSNENCWTIQIVIKILKADATQYVKSQRQLRLNLLDLLDGGAYKA